MSVYIPYVTVYALIIYHYLLGPNLIKVVNDRVLLRVSPSLLDVSQSGPVTHQVRNTHNSLSQLSNTLHSNHTVNT